MPKRAGTKKELVQRVKKAVKKSRRRLGAEKFEKELTRTITFLEDLQKKVAQLATAAKKAQGPAKAKGATVKKDAAKKSTAKKTTAKKAASKKAASKKAVSQKTMAQKPAVVSPVTSAAGTSKKK